MRKRPPHAPSTRNPMRPSGVPEFAEEAEINARAKQPLQLPRGSHKEIGVYLCNAVRQRTFEQYLANTVCKYLERMIERENPDIGATVIGVGQDRLELNQLIEHLDPALRAAIRGWLGGFSETIGGEPDHPGFFDPQVPPPPSIRAGFTAADAIAVDPMSISEEQKEAAHGRSSYVPPSRAGKKQLMGYFDEEIIKALRVLALRQDTTMKALLEEAVHDVLAKHNIDPTKIQQLLEGRNPN